MNTNLHRLDYIINIEKFQKIQDDIATATDMAIIAIDYKGTPITKHSKCSDFCKEVRKDETLSKFCEKCDSRGGLEAARNQEAYIYICHIGVVDFAIPIIVDGQYLGALMAGQIRLDDEKNNQILERIVSKNYQVDLDQYPELKKLYEQLHIMSLEKIKAVAHMMYHIINYIVEDAVLKTSLNELNQKLTMYKEESSRILSNNIEISETEISEEHLQIISKETSFDTGKSILLKPAINYINENYNKKIYLDDMAFLCNISPSYFSKIFKREIGSNFSTYLNKVKSAKAKELLETTLMPIINISLNLGYDDCGYFIKVFKKNYGITPAHYRKEYVDNKL